MPIVFISYAAADKPVIDDLIVYTGSYNHSESATTKHDENYIIKDIGIAHIYETQFQKPEEA